MLIAFRNVRWPEADVTQIEADFLAPLHTNEHWVDYQCCFCWAGNLGVFMSPQSVAYALGGTLTEQQRLIAQAKGLELHAKWLLDQIGVASGQRTADVGCGPIGILNLLSARVGRDGVVVGVEREPRFFDMAQAELDARRLQNVKLVRTDALHTGLERSYYDFVHERLLLINFPPASQHALLTEMIALLKPGGTIAVQEFDSASYVCYPEHPSWDMLLSIVNVRLQSGNILCCRRETLCGTFGEGLGQCMILPSLRGQASAPNGATADGRSFEAGETEHGQGYAGDIVS
jgi:SAM-dependent methyltransferase